MIIKHALKKYFLFFIFNVQNLSNINQLKQLKYRFFFSIIIFFKKNYFKNNREKGFIKGYHTGLGLGLLRFRKAHNSPRLPRGILTIRPFDKILIVPIP